MNEPYTPYEPFTPSQPQGSSATREEGSTLASDMTDAAAEFESRETRMRHMASAEVESPARSTTTAFPANAEQVLDDAQERIRAFQRESERYIRENPARSVFYMLGVGFVLGLICRR